jgi:hypothetical protein
MTSSGPASAAPHGSATRRIVSTARGRLWQKAQILKFSRVARRASAQRFVLCIGDSHLEPMNLVRDSGHLTQTRLVVHAVGGATASGAQNPNSKTNAYATWLPYLSRLGPDVTVVSVLGEVDTGFLIFTRPDHDEGLARSVTRYQEFLDKEVLSRGAKLIVASVIPPVIEDYSTWPGPDGQKRDIDASWDQRNQMSSRFNDAMAAWCVERGAAYLDLGAGIRDERGRVRPEFRHPNSDDHHLEPNVGASIFQAALCQAGFR